MTTPLDMNTYLDLIETEGHRLADAAAQAGPDASVPTCPDWTVRDLVLHVGEVHRWATAVVDGALAKPSLIPDDYLGPLPSDGDLIDWFQLGHAHLINTLRRVPADLECFTFLADPPSARVFWARRQAHEIEMHRVDAESARGTLTAFDPAVAADGIDEMLTGFVPRKFTPLHADPPHSIAVTLTDAPNAWLMTIDAGIPVTARGNATADCTVTGTASDVYLALWNRQDTSPLTITGDAALLDMFRENVRVRWS